MSLFGQRESRLCPRGFYLLHGHLGATASDLCHHTKRHASRRRRSAGLGGEAKQPEAIVRSFSL